MLFHTQLPALGIANALLKGRSDGAFQMAVVAAKDPSSEADLLMVLDQRQLAPGRIYLNRISQINGRQVFSRVGGVAIGDHYQASISHDLSSQGPLHVPLTSTNRHHFGTREVQVNSLVSRMVDSSLDNVGTYGVRFDVDLNLFGAGPYELVMSHPSNTGSNKPFTAFRGSLQIRTDEGLQEMHVGLRSGQSLPLTTLNLRAGSANPVRISLVYPADATPGHLLSVVPASQIAMLQERERQLEMARSAANSTAATRPSSLPTLPDPAETPDGALRSPRPLVLQPSIANPQPLHSPHRSLPPPPPPPAPVVEPQQRSAVPSTGTASQSLVDRYQQALEAQQQMIRGLMGR